MATKTSIERDEPPGAATAPRSRLNSFHRSPGWRERSRFIARHGEVEYFHFDVVSQALAKLARAHDRDLSDVRAMLEHRLLTSADLTAGLDAISAELVRYPALDATAFARRVRALVERPDG